MSIPSFYRTNLATSLQIDGDEVEIFVEHATNVNGEEIDFSEFTPFTRGTLVISPTASRESTEKPEICSFTGFDAEDKKFTGCIRGISGIDGVSRDTLKTYHEVGAEVVIAWSGENIQDILDYVSAVVEGELGTASDEVAGSTKVSEDQSSLPRAVSTLVRQQEIPNMTLHVMPFAISQFHFAGGDTTTFTAPTVNPKIDILCYDTDTGDLVVRQGVEAGSPTRPSINSSDMPLCEIFHRTTETTLLERDTDSDEGYIRRWYQPWIDPIPTGFISPYGASTVPSTAWALCNGQALSRTTDSKLFSIIGETYGVGDGSTTFNVPDLRGSVLVGAGQRTFVLDFDSSTDIDVGSAGVTVSSASSNTLTFSGNHNLVTGQPFYFPSSAPSELSNNKIYNAIVISATAIKVATSYENAVGTGTYIQNLGSGTGATLTKPVRFISSLKYPYNGRQVTLSTSDTVPTGLAPATSYNVVRFPNISGFYFADSLTLAARKTVTLATTAGVGIQTLTWQQSNFTLGSYVGEEEHLLALEESPKHRHQRNTASGTGSNDAFLAAQGSSSGLLNIYEDEGPYLNDVGLDLPHNNMQPSVVSNFIIKR